LDKKSNGEQKQKGGEMMARIEKSATINAPVDKVFTFCSDIEGYTRFMEGAKEIKMTGDKSARWKMEMAGRMVEFDTEMTDVIENEKIAWKSKGDFAAVGSWTLEPAGEETKINMLMDYEIPGIMGKIFDKVKVSKEMEQSMETSLQNLKKLVEE
jgi:uncharacterized membrane protein